MNQNVYGSVINKEHNAIIFFEAVNNNITTVSQVEVFIVNKEGDDTVYHSSKGVFVGDIADNIVFALKNRTLSKDLLELVLSAKRQKEAVVIISPDEMAKELRSKFECYGEIDFENVFEMEVFMDWLQEAEKGLFVPQMSFFEEEDITDQSVEFVHDDNVVSNLGIRSFSSYVAEHGNKFINSFHTEITALEQQESYDVEPVYQRRRA
jgi:hypothetical protein